MPVAGELIAFVTFTTESSGLVVADGILVTDIRDGSAFVDVWSSNTPTASVKSESPRNFS